MLDSLRLSKTGPSAVESTLVYLAMLAYTVLAGRHFNRFGGFIGTMLFTLGLGVLPVLYALIRGYSIISVFRIRAPRPRDVVGGLIMSAGLFLFVLMACDALAYFAPGLGEDSSPVRDFLVRGNGLVAVIAVAVLPAVCEEILFRGLILSGLSASAGKWPAIILCGCLFGFLHMQPLQIPFTAIVGVGLAYAAFETGSIVVPVVMHCAHNLLLLLIVRNAGAAASGGTDSGLRAIRETLALGLPARLALYALTAAVAVAIIGSSAFFVYCGARMLRRTESTAVPAGGNR
ncbi:MAG TPA: type II CAAX endopeptidase family protein [Treponemataceae bacterium]|nr:type II CAAX endopeptidase family protein [Treponemataceae bacterium]HPS43814.1 type II CAAX endopeptidase family protein [Treponemataceae bacterium]